MIIDDKRYAVREAENAYKEAEQLVTIYGIKMLLFVNSYRFVFVRY